MVANQNWLDEDFRTRSEEETRALARDFAAQATLLPALVLCGPLGAGKTRFVQGLAEGLGAHEVAISPTFALVQEYQTATRPLFHFDFYRLTSEQEVWDLGFEEYLADGLVVVEWGEKFPAVFPPHTWAWTLAVKDEERLLHCQRWIGSDPTSATLA
jgi:tRNA threonylcarbamoyladenosine biosynthesis protein TsaE